MMTNTYSLGNNLLVEANSMVEQNLLLALEEALLGAQEQLQAFASDSEFGQKIELAFGSGVNAEELREAWQAGDFSQLPSIEIRSATEINGVNGAFAAATNKIYLSHDFLKVNIQNPQAIASVLLEEIGHFIDAQINTVDSLGDEGAIFSALVQGESLSNEQLALLQAEDDSLTLADGTQIEAATLKVDTLVDENDGNFKAGDLSLREAIALARSGDTITFAKSGTITLTLGQLNINKALTINGDIDGNGTPDMTVSGNNASRVFNIDDGNFNKQIVVGISGLIINRGWSLSEGGGVFNRENLTLNKSSVLGNYAKSTGGGIRNAYGTVNLKDTTLVGNYSDSSGGGIFSEGGRADLSNSILSTNYATVSGGGIEIGNAGKLSLTNSRVSSNSVKILSGGGIAISPGGEGILSDSIVSDNSAAFEGGGISNFGTVRLTNSTVSGNFGKYGGGIRNAEAATVLLTNSKLVDNSAEYGGGIDNRGSINLSNSTLSNNSAKNDGGAIYNYNPFSGTEAKINLNNSTVSTNSAASGGGIFNDRGKINLSQSTVHKNSASNGGGIVNNGTATLTNSIISGSVGGGKDFFGVAPTLIGNNLIADGSILRTSTNGVINGDPRLGPLQNNGGPTFTHQLLPGSPAIDAGNNAVAQDTLDIDNDGNPTEPLPFDQRGKERFFGKIDLGAFEVNQSDRLVNLEVKEILAKEARDNAGQRAKFIVTRNSTLGNLDVIINLAGSATPDADYRFKSGILNGNQLKVTIPDGQWQSIVEVEAIDDSLVENTNSIVENFETIDLQVSSAKDLNGAIVYNAESGKSNISLRVGDNEPLLTINPSSAGTNNASEANKIGKFFINFSQKASRPFTLFYDLAGKAIKEEDYTVSALVKIQERDQDPVTEIPVTIPNGENSLNIPIGAISAEILINVENDAIDEDDETVTLKLRDPEGVNYGIRNGGEASILIEDNDTAGIEIDPISRTGTTSEDGGKAEFKFKLKSKPLDNVVLQLNGLDTSEGSLSSDSLTFTPDNYSQFQTVTIAGLDDGLVDGNVKNTITVDAISKDAKYDTLQTKFDYENQDNDKAGITLNIQDVETSETGDNANFTVVLNTQPSDTVTLDIKGVDNSEGTLSTPSLIFDSSNWDIPQTVTVIGADDFIVDETQTYTISFDASRSLDDSYRLLTQANLDQLGKQVKIANLDNDTAGVTLSAISGETTENGTEATFTVQLNSQPLENVEIKLTSTDESEGTVSPASLIFSRDNFSTPQTVTVTGVDDGLIDGNQPFTIRTTVISSDEKYKNIEVADFQVVNTDNDVVPTASINAGDSIIEGDTGTFKISLDRPALEGGVTVQVVVSGTATSGKDFSLIETIRLSEGETEKTLTLASVNDRIAEDTETITLTLLSVNSDREYIPSTTNNTATLSLNDNDVAGVKLTASNNTNESGGQSAIEVVLTSQPEAAVEINLASSNLSEGTLSGSKLIFTPENWDKAQIVTATGVDDNEADSTQRFEIQATATSSDLKYSNIAINPLQLINQDNEGFGVLIIPSNGNVVVSEAGNTDSYQIALTQPSTGTVQITATADSGTEISLNGVDFAPIQTISLNDTTPQTVIVRALADGEVTGDRTSSIVHRITASSDPNYPTDFVVDTLRAAVKDQDLPTVSILSTANGSEESMVSGQFNLLLSAAAPAGGITINYQVEATSTARASNNEPFKLGEPDYFVLPGSIFIPEGATGATIEVLPTPDDDVTEPLETVNLSLIAGSGYLVDTAKASNTLSISDNDIAGVRITESGNQTGGLEGTSDDYTVRLTSQPRSNVEVVIATDKNSEVIDKFIFTPTNWNISQTVNVNFVNDGIVTGDRKSIITHKVNSEDSDYQNIEVRNVEATVLEDEVAGITVSPTIELKEGERGVVAYTLVLDTKPTADVTITFSPDSLFEAIVPITFTPDNWNISQNVLVTPVNDNQVTGNRTGTIIQKVISDDLAFNNLPVKNALVSVLDNDTAGIVVTVSDDKTQIREGNQTDSFTIALGSQPASDVKIEFLTTSPLSPLAPVIFTPQNWNEPRTVNVVAVNDGISQGAIGEKTPIRLSVISNDAGYNGFKLNDIPVDIADVAGVTVTKTSFQVGEGERPTTYQIRLNSEPYSDVTIDFASTGGLLEAIAPITFTRSNWNQPQTITVKGVEGGLAAADLGSTTIRQTVTSADPSYNNLNLSDVNVSVLSDNTFLTWDEFVAEVGKRVGAVPSGLKTTLETRLGSLFLPVTLKGIEGGRLLLSYPGDLNANNLLQKLPDLGTIATNLKLANSLGTIVNPQIEVEGFDLKQPEFNLILPALNAETIRGLLTNVKLGEVANNLLANVPVLDLQVERDRLSLGYLNNQSANDLLGKIPGVKDLANTLNLPNLTVDAPSITIIDPATNPRYELTAASLPVNSLQSWLTTQVDALDSALPDPVQNAIKALANTAQDLDLVVSDNAVKVTYGDNLNVKEIINQLANKLGLSNPLPAELVIANPALKILNPGDDPSFEFTAPRVSIASLQSWLANEVNSLLPSEIQNLTNEAQNLDLILAEDQLRLSYLGDINVGSAVNELTETLGLGRPFSNTLAVNNPEVAIQKNDSGDFTYSFIVPRLARANVGSLLSGLNAPSFINSVLSEISNLGLTFGKDKLELTYNGDFDLRNPINQLASALGLGTPISSPLTVSNPSIRIQGTGSERTFELAVSQLSVNQSVDLMENIFGRKLPDEVTDSLRSIGNNLDDLEFVLSQNSITLSHQGKQNFAVDIDDILGKSPAFIKNAIKAANKAFFGSEELKLEIGEPEVSVATGPELGFAAELNGKEINIIYDKDGDYQLRYELPEVVDFSSFAKDVPILGLFKLSDPELLIANAAERIDDPKLGSITLVEGLNFLGTIDFESAQDRFSKFINEYLGIKSLGALASLGSNGASIAAVVPLDTTLLSLNDFRAKLKNLQLSLAVDGTGEPNFGFKGNVELQGYDPFQSNEPTLFLSGNIKLETNSVTSGFALQAGSRPWVNPFGIPDTEIRNLALQLGATYQFPFVDNVGFLGDFRFGNYDLKAAFSVDINDPDNIALLMKTNQPLTLTDLLVGPVGSFALKQVGDKVPVIDKTLDLLDTILDVTVSGVDLNNDGENEPLIQFVPFKTDIAGIPVEEGFGINAQVDAYGVKGKVALNADKKLSEIIGSLALSRINLGGLGVVVIEGANNDPELNLDFKVGINTPSLISGDGSVKLFGLKLAEADFKIGLDNVDIKGKVALPGLQLNTEFAASNITKSNLKFSGSASASVFGNPIVNATISGDRNRFAATGNLNLLGIPGVLQGNANATVALGTTPNDFALSGSGNLSIFNNQLANVNFTGNRNGISATGRLNFPGIPGVLTGGVNANVAIGNNDFALSGSGNLSILGYSIANVNFTGNRNGISATGRLNFPGIPGVLTGGVNANVAIGNNDFALSGSGNLSILGYSIANVNFAGNRNGLTATGGLSLGIPNVLQGNINSTVAISSNLNNFSLSGNGNVSLLGRDFSNISVSGSKDRLAFGAQNYFNTPFGSASSDLFVKLNSKGFDLNGQLNVSLPAFGFRVLGKRFDTNTLSFAVSPDLYVDKSGRISGGLNDIKLSVFGKSLPEFDINLGVNSGFDSFDDIIEKIRREVEGRAKGIAKGIVNEAIEAAQRAAEEAARLAREAAEALEQAAEQAVEYVGGLFSGSVEGSTIWFDANNNGIFDPDEPNTITQSDGTYILEIPKGFVLSTGLIRSQGGIDTTTGLPFQTTLAALLGSNITPITVLMQQLVTNGATIDEALGIVQTEFGISPNIDLYGFDHLDETLNANPEARAVILAVNKVQSAVLGVQNLLAGAGGGTVAEQGAAVNSVLSAAAYSAVADLIVSNQLNLEDANQVETIIRAAATEAQSVLQTKGLSFNIDLNVIDRVADEAAQVLVAGAIKKQILSDEADDGFDLLRRITQAKRVSNGEEANALNLLGQGKLTETEILALADTSADALAAIRAVTLLPQLGGVSDLFLVEGDRLADFPITLYDFETPQDKLIVNITSDNEKLVPAGNVVLTSGSSEYTRFLNISPVAGQTGSATIKISVTDSDGQTIDQAFVVTVEANKAPIFLSTGSFTVSSNAEPGTVVGNLDANDGNGGVTDLSVGYSITSGNDDLNSNGDRPFSIDLNGEIFVNDPDDLMTAVPGAQFNLTVTASDGNGGTDSAQVTVTVESVILGTDGNDTLQGTAANDVFDGKLGDDRMSGSAGNDLYIVDSIRDVVVEAANEGIDSVQSSVNYTLGNNVENLSLTVNSNTNGTGNALDNIITGNDGNNLLKGLAGKDTLQGTGGNDILVGGAGDDLLTGGTGADQFLFGSGAAFTTTALGVDTISDFISGSDKIALSKATFTALTSAINGTLQANEFVIINAEVANQLSVAGNSTAKIVYNALSGDLFYNQNGGAAGLGTGGLFATLSSKPSLVVNDLFVQA